jgi:predicted nuclease of predicted toxin-antitoxin system
MALRFLGDHCISNFIIQTLREANHEVVRLRDVLPAESSDDVVIAKAQEIDAVLLSLNGDFADIVSYPPSNYKGIVALQMRNHPEALPNLMTRLTAYLKVQPAMEHYHGKLLVVEVNRIRIRK